MCTLKCIIERFNNLAMFLLSNTKLQFSFKDPCHYNTIKFEINNTSQFIKIQPFSLIQNIPVITYTHQYYLSTYSMVYSLNMQLSCHSQFIKIKHV
jgi:hypothetical protein